MYIFDFQFENSWLWFIDFKRAVGIGAHAPISSFGGTDREIEGGAFSPLVMNTAGGIATEFVKVVRTLSQRISTRTHEPYSEVVAHLRTRLRFALLQSCLVALRGNRRKIVASSLADAELLI